MEDYDGTVGPSPTQDVSLFETTRYQHELNRLFDLPGIKNTFSEPDDSIKGYTFRSLLNELEPATNLYIDER